MGMSFPCDLGVCATMYAPQEWNGLSVVGLGRVVRSRASQSCALLVVPRNGGMIRCYFLRISRGQAWEPAVNVDRHPRLAGML
jgi:hypothetical protein